ncbi:30S ribosomal protein S6 alpha- chloroplastic [Striga hermonthica]|uniref:30S ribosomal protein S6 alpha- chloroplastic n=1 Tax=Striga hermonthica TaxID=68872 RepID=A0A9N7MKB9_STRHE|nr:30S ribosomal protein S6 alpha- chloroplastic [Striga hermonthica]
MVSNRPVTKIHSPSPNFLRPFKSSGLSKAPPLRRPGSFRIAASDVTEEFDFSLFDVDVDDDYEDDIDDDELDVPVWGFPTVEDVEETECPPGLRKYETMMVLRPDMSEDERLAVTQKYEELLVAGGGMYVEVFNRGIIPLSYDIRRKNRDGETNTYMDGIFLLFKYFTKPESISILKETGQADDNVIRSSTFKVRKRKLF